MLYELLTGRQTFAGETITDILGAVVSKEPDWKLLPEGTPWGIRRLLQRCLEKDPHERLRDIGDARIEIRQAQTEPVDPALAQVAPVGAPTSWRRGAILGVLIGLVGSAAAFFFWNLAYDSQPVQPTAARLSVVLPDGVTLDPRHLALSPDGSHLVYPASRGGTSQLYVRALDQLESKPIPYTEGAMYPFFSPDGKWVGFFSSPERLGGALRRVSVIGGTPQNLCEVTTSRGASWG